MLSEDHGDVRMLVGVEEKKGRLYLWCAAECTQCPEHQLGTLFSGPVESQDFVHLSSSKKAWEWHIGHACVAKVGYVRNHN